MATFASDFETTTDPDDCRVWAWQSRNLETDEVFQGLDIASFVENAPRGLHYFHNLAFDASFIIDYLERHLGYEYVELDKTPEGKAEGRHILHNKQLTALIGDQGQFYSMEYSGPQGKLEFRDSLKKIPGTLKELGWAYGAPVKKGDIDYHKPRPVGYQPDKDEWEYLDNDTAILAHVLNVVIGEGYTSMTIGGDCFRDWKKMFHQKFGDSSNGNTDSTFRKSFPEFNHAQERNLRKAYRGGWTYCDPRYQGQLLTCGGVVYDVNSMYPGVMVQELFPVGIPYELAPYEDAPRMYPLVIRGGIVSYTLKERGLPCIPMNVETFGGSGWSRASDEVELWGTSREWALWEDMYDLHIEEDLGGYAFMAMSGEEMFGDYIEHYMKIKANTKGPKRLLAKLSLNNLWGKFATNPMKGRRIPTITNCGPVVLEATPLTFESPVYTPVGVFTTAYARERIVRAAAANYDRFCYADTDSLHLTGTEVPAAIEVHESALGAWAHEGTWTEARYCRSKAYVERLTEESDSLILDKATGKRNISVAMAGLPSEARHELTPESVYDGMEFDGKLARRRVVGGIVLAAVKWKLDYRLGIVETSELT